MLLNENQKKYGRIEVAECDIICPNVIKIDPIGCNIFNVDKEKEESEVESNAETEGVVNNNL